MDEDFFPAYYVDVSLAMAIRRYGQIVLYEPASRIVHRRASSTGLRLRTFVSERNRRRFLAKWEHALADHEPPPESSESSSTSIARATARAARLAEHARTNRLPTAAASAPQLDVDAHERRHSALDVALHREYARHLETVLDLAESESAALRARAAAVEGAERELTELRARSAVLATIERGRWWSVYRRMAPLRRRFTGSEV
jgi:hypothetical protein